MIFIVSSAVLALLVASLWCIDHYWRNLSVSWLAAFSMLYLALSNFEDATIMQRAWLLALVSSLLLWSMLLTPVQLLVSTAKERHPTAHADVLWDPLRDGVDSDPIQADIFCVHGLGASADSTWIDKGSGTHWLRDVLPTEFGKCRIIVLNHDSCWDAYSPVQSLRDYGQAILESISLRVDEVEQKRPLVLIGHSFGGILLKKALTLAMEHTNDFRKHSVAEAVIGVFFFGTPHKGSHFALLGTISSHFSYWRGSRSNLLEFITPSSKELEDLHMSFLTSYPYLYMCNLFETQQMKMFGIPLSLVVTKASATIDGQPAVALNANHRNLQRFRSAKDPNYQLFRDRLKDALSIIKHRITQEKYLEQYSVPFSLKGAPMSGEFIGRADQLQQMQKLLGIPHEIRRRRVLVVQGLGGIGKTQLAIEYAIQHQRNYTAILWVNGKTELTLRLSLASLAEQICLSHVLDSQGRLRKGESIIKNAITAVMSWFAEPTNTRWLLVIDNVDCQTEVVMRPKEGQENSYDIRQYFPSNTHGSVVVTTRLSRLRRFGMGLELDELDPDSSLRLLCQASGQSISEEGSRAVANRLHGLPLALCHAGAYINEAGISSKKFLELYNKQSSTLLNQTDDLTYEHGSLLSSWELSYWAVKSRDPAAGKILMLWAFLDNFDLWWELFHAALENASELAWYQEHLQLPNSRIPSDLLLEPDWLTALARNESNFVQAIGVLRDFSFTRMSGSDSFSIHPIVHEWAISRQDEREWHQNLDSAILVIGRALPLAHHKEAWILQRRLAPCIDQILATISKADTSLLSAYDGMVGLAFYSFDWSHFASAVKLYDIIIPGFERVWGKEHPKMVKAVHDRALCYRVLKEYEKAESAWKWTLEITTRTEGPLAELSLRALDDLGRLYMMQGRAAEAYEVLLLALEGKQKTQPDRLETFDTMRQVGLACQQLSRFDEAQILHQTSWRHFDEILGPDHTWTLLSIRDMGILQQRLGKHENAIDSLQKALQTMEIQLGPTHNYALEILQDLAGVYEDIGKLGDAELYLRRALDRCSGDDGKAKHMVAAIQEKLADICSRIQMRPT